MAKNIKIVGNFKWHQVRDSMIQKLHEIDNEDDFIEFWKMMICSLGTAKQINKKRKELGLKPLTKEEIREIGK